MRAWWMMVGLGAVGLAEAKAPKGPELDWPVGETRRYVLHADYFTPNAMPMNAINNIDTISMGFRLDMVMTCTATEPLGRRGVRVSCPIDDASWQGRPIPSGVGLASQVAAEWSRLLKEGRIEFEARRDGRIMRTELHDVPRDRVREQVIHQVMRETIVRALSTLDVALPPTPFAEGLTWKERDTLVLGLPSLDSGSVGGAQLDLTFAAQTPAGALAAYTGRGTLGWGVEQNENLRDMMAMEFQGSWLFDEERSTVVQAQYIGSGEPTAGSAQATGPGMTYKITASAMLLEDGADPPALPPPGETTQPPGG